MNDSCRSSLRSQLSIATLFAVIFVGLATRTSAQTIPPSATVNRLAHLNDFAKRAGANFEGRLSMGGATMFHLARVRPGLHMEDAARIPAAQSAMAASKARFNAQLQSLRMDKVDIAGSGHGPVPVSDASLDYVLSRFSGFTQSETSSAWCGDNVVVGFNDSGADLRSFVDQAGGRSFANVGVSHNGGKSFVGLPYLNPGPNPADFLAGDPVLVCSSPQHFVYSSLYSRNTFDSNGNQTSALTGLAVNHSQDGGLTWGNPIPIVTKDGFLNFVDKEWMAVDSRNPRNVYVTYTDFEIPGTDPLCGSPLGVADILSLSVRLEMVSSHDGGYTWGAPVLIEDDCNLGSLGNLSGTQVAVGPKGQVYVAYTASDADFAEIRFTQSTDGGASFHSVVVVADTTAASAIAVGLEGGFRTTTFPTLAVDNSLGPRRGSIYLTWTDGSHNIIQDLASFVTFAYSFGDIVIASSSDGGSSWSTPKLVSPTPSTFKGRGRDQFMSGMAVDSRGNLAVCYSDRRNDTDNLLIDHYCSLSANGGITFTDIRQTASSWAPSHFTDLLINPAYMGDYDSVSADSTGAQSGFFSSFQIQRNLNPDVFGTRVKLN